MLYGTDRGRAGGAERDIGRAIGGEGWVDHTVCLELVASVAEGYRGNLGDPDHVGLVGLKSCCTKGEHVGSAWLAIELEVREECHTVVRGYALPGEELAPDSTSNRRANYRG